jgi:hypothetical protein
MFSQKCFIPHDRTPEFADGRRDVVHRNHATLVNVTIRTVQPKVEAPGASHSAYVSHPK